MELKYGDLIITLPKVEKIKAILRQLTGGMIGVVVEASAEFNKIKVYGILIDGEIFYLFEDEIEKLEDDDEDR
jgi:hypothetical protein